MKFAKRVDFKYSHHIDTNGNYVNDGVLINLIMVIISQCICIYQNTLTIYNFTCQVYLNKAGNIQ